MREVPASMTEAWKAEDKTGSRRPVIRATIAKANLMRHTYDTFHMPGGEWEPDKHRKGHFTTLVFGNPAVPREIPNIKEFTWTRSVNQDVAEATLTLLNTDITPIGAASDEHQEDFDRPGWLTYNRGAQNAGRTRWGFTKQTGWKNMFVPDRIIRTYEGYGLDETKSPHRDPNLVQTGMWLIDDVDYSHEGLITLRMRDIGRMLLDQMCFPPVIPNDEYPIEWKKIRSVNIPGRDCTGGQWTELRGKGTVSSSNERYMGKGLTDPPLPHYVGPKAGVLGHRAEHALENRTDKFWWSTGQTTRNSKVWWQFDFDNPIAMNALRIHLQGGPYRIYISIHDGDKWIGKRKIPYRVTTEGIDIGAGIPFVRHHIGERHRSFELILKRIYPKVKKIRLTFGQLKDDQIGTKYPYRAGLKDCMVYTAPTAGDLGFKQGTFQKVVGNYADYTQIVKWALAWGGWFWPPHSTDLDFMMVGRGDKLTLTHAERDFRFPKGRVWGNFQRTYTQGQVGADLTADLFDKKPLMDMINYVRDITGFVFFVDECGGAIWRYPNIRGLGNYLTNPGQLTPRSTTRSAVVPVIDEYETLIDYSTTMSSRNQRERVFVANHTGKVGTVVKGYKPYPGNLRRIAGWTDQHFETNREARIAADMIVARQAFAFRRGKVRIPAYPAIQIDDQVRIYERVTNETFYHYVESITSTINMDTGEWYYDLDTHWLGEDPNDIWVVKVAQMDTVTQSYLNNLGPVD